MSGGLTYNQNSMKAAKDDAFSAIGRRIREERKRRGLTQRALADATGLSDRYISNLEQGVRQPAPRTVQSIAGALGIQPRDLYANVPSIYKPLDADLTALASILKDASPADRARAIDVVRSLVRPSKTRRRRA